MISIKNTLFILFTIYPLAILAGNTVINSIIFVTAILIFFTTFRKLDFFYKDKIFWVLSFFFFSLLINLLFTSNFESSYPRVIKIIFIIFFIFSFKYLIFNSNKVDLYKIYKVWSIIVSIIIIDLLIEYFNGKNIIGLTSIMPGQRLASFTGMESVIGNFFLGFSLILLAFAYDSNKNSNINFLLALFLIVISFIIGERANFLRTFIAICAFLLIVDKKSIKIKVVTFIFLILSFIIFLNINTVYKNRYIDEIKLILKEKSTKKYLENSHYGAHFNVAKEIFKDSPMFGVGIKNFRYESGSKKYDNLDHSKNYLRFATHPHQIYYEFLAETGLFGFLSFLIFIFISIYLSLKEYLINRNIYQISGTLVVIVYLIPFLPTGSFLSTYTSSIFWINYAIMVGYIGLKK
ncbi:O-antigen ligase family protein [Candidatus Pelagibacter sp.]|nr:O-antigen ligase family protein [Candidatus Pelagibacter sp.]